MKQMPSEDWTFDICVVHAQPCRLGLEAGDRFAFQYGCPAGFCPKTMGFCTHCAKLYAAAAITCCGAVPIRLKLIFPVRMAVSLSI